MTIIINNDNKLSVHASDISHASRKFEETSLADSRFPTTARDMCFPQLQLESNDASYIPAPQCSAVD